MIWFYLLDPSQEYQFWLFAFIYFILSMLSVSTQFGLTFLRYTNSKQGYRQVVVAQSILASVFHSSLILTGSILVQDLDWRAPLPLCVVPVYYPYWS